MLSHIPDSPIRMETRLHELTITGSQESRPKLRCVGALGELKIVSFGGNDNLV
jgi:hypothetical protein